MTFIKSGDLIRKVTNHCLPFTGRILNRFSKDMGLLDENLPLVMFDFIQVTIHCLAVTLVFQVQ